MLEADACRTIALAITNALGLKDPAQVKASGFHLQIDRVKTAKWMEQGCIVQVSFDGWGQAFEERKIIQQFAVDLKWDRSETIQNVLKQFEHTMHFQIAQRVQAQAKGIEKPLTREEFQDLKRYEIDIAAARVLRKRFDTDDLVRDWLQSELRKVRSGTRINEKRPEIDLKGLEIIVPCLLEPLEMTDSRLPLPGRPRWISNTIDLLRADWTSQNGVFHFLEHALDAIGIRDRAFIEGEMWPDVEWRDAIDKWNTKAKRDGGLPQWSQPPDMWRVTMETNLVSVMDAFC